LASGKCCLLHFETYAGQISAPLEWTPTPGKISYNPDGCVHNSIATKPAALLDPRPLLNCLKPATASLLQDSGVGSEEQQADQVSAATKGHLSPGYIALIVIVAVLVCVAIGVMVFCLVRRGRRNASSNDMVVSNSLYDPNAQTQQASGADNNSAVFFSARDVPMSGGTMSMGTMGGADSTQLMRPSGSAAPIGHFKTATAFDLPTPNFATRTMTSPVEMPGQFQCTICQKSYQYQTDLTAHNQLRHQM